jgi:hypothetical protein
MKTVKGIRMNDDDELRDGYIISGPTSKKQYAERYKDILIILHEAEQRSGVTVTHAADNPARWPDNILVCIYHDTIVHGGFSYVDDEAILNRLTREIKRYVDCGQNYTNWRDNVTAAENEAKKKIWEKITE